MNYTCGVKLSKTSLVKGLKFVLPLLVTVNPETFVLVYSSRFASTDKSAPEYVRDWSQFPQFFLLQFYVSRRLTFAISHHRENREGFRVYTIQ